MEWDLSGPYGVGDDDVGTSGFVGDLVEAIKRGSDGLQDEARKTIDRMRERYAAERRARALRLTAVVVVGYYLLRGRRR